MKYYKVFSHADKITSMVVKSQLSLSHTQNRVFYAPYLFILLLSQMLLRLEFSLHYSNQSIGSPMELVAQLLHYFQYNVKLQRNFYYWDLCWAQQQPCFHCWAMKYKAGLYDKHSSTNLQIYLRYLKTQLSPRFEWGWSELLGKAELWDCTCKNQLYHCGC